TPADPGTAAVTGRAAAADTAADTATGTGMSMRDRGFLGSPEGILLDRMRHGQIRRVKKGSGGRSLGFKLYFAEGGKAYFKPDQSFSGTNWYAELAAYHLDRALGLGRVPPVVGRTIPWGRLETAAADDRRVPEIQRDSRDRVRGALIWWLDKPPQPATTPPGWENWIRVEPLSRWKVSPLQRAAAYGAALRHRRERARAGKEALAAFESVPEPDTPERAAELSDLLLFDFLTINIDRWGGNNANVLTLGRGGPLIFLDNAAGFSVGPHERRLMDDRFRLCQRFRRSTVEALKALDMEALERRLVRDPIGPVLDDHFIEGIAVRRRIALEHIAEMRQRHGDDDVLAW
ncbi:MAG: hypothetical protein OXT09_09950, partial [Myxococcales bacterium]|nr:hypothetical protein [Myxococcales bacterium]